MFDIGLSEILVLFTISILVFNKQQALTIIKTIYFSYKKISLFLKKIKEDIIFNLEKEKKHSDLKIAESLKFNNLPNDIKNSVDELKKSAEFVNNKK